MLFSDLGQWYARRQKASPFPAHYIAYASCICSLSYHVSNARWQARTPTIMKENSPYLPRDAQRVLPQQQSGLRAFFIASLFREREDV
jgi:hypothetical protein